MAIYGSLNANFVGEMLQPRPVTSYNGRPAAEALIENNRRILMRGDRVPHVNRLLVQASGSLAENMLNNWKPGAVVHLQGELIVFSDRTVLQAYSLLWICGSEGEDLFRRRAGNNHDSDVAPDTVNPKG